MKKKTESNSDGWRKTTPEEKARFRKMALNTLKRLGRPHLPPEVKYKAISIKLDPRILKWAKAEAKKRNIGYQTVINQELLKKAS
jgi:uncharacterized protein (DUF4415 family)